MLVYASSVEKFKAVLYFSPSEEHNTCTPKGKLSDTQLAISCEFDFYVHLFLNKPPYDTFCIDYQ